jgi:hypothetical protein
MASAGGGAAGEGEWLKVAELRAVVEAQDPQAKVTGHLLLLLPACSLINYSALWSLKASLFNIERLIGIYIYIYIYIYTEI